MSAGPRHSRKEIRDFAAWLRKQGWIYESTDSKGHTLWSHPSCSTPYKLAETPKHFNVQLSRRDVLRLMGQKVEGKRRPKPAPAAPAPSARTPRPQETRPVAPPKRKTSRYLPWEGADQDDYYDHGIDRMMREVPGR